jgi:hypothetical protein
MGAMSTAQRAGLLTGAVFDSFGRDFGFDFGAAAISMRADSLLLLSDAMDRRIDSVTEPDGSGGISLVAFAPNDEDSRYDQMAIAHFRADGSGWAATKGAASPLLDAPAAPRLGLAPAPAEFATARVMLDRTASSVAFRTAFGEDNALTIGFSQQSGDTFGETFLAARRKIGAASNVEINAQRQMDRVALSAGIAMLTETGGRLGETSDSMFATSGDARTFSAQFRIAAALTDRLTLGAQAAAARTGAQRGLDTGLVTNVAETTSLAYAITLAAADTLASGDRLDFTIGQPLMSRSGAMDLEFATGADSATGAPIIERRRISLDTQTPETRMELGYARKMGPTRFAFAAMSRFNADGEAGRDVHALMVRAATSF